jgi:hypothetical protein
MWYFDALLNQRVYWLLPAPCARAEMLKMFRRTACSLAHGQYFFEQRARRLLLNQAVGSACNCKKWTHWEFDPGPVVAGARLRLFNTSVGGRVACGLAATAICGLHPTAEHKYAQSVMRRVCAVYACQVAASRSNFMSAPASKLSILADVQLACSRGDLQALDSMVRLVPGLDAANPRWRQTVEGDVKWGDYRWLRYTPWWRMPSDWSGDA